MRKFGLLLALVLAFPLVSQAQKITLYGGYSYLRLDSTPNKANLNGWDVSLTDHLVSALGLAADFGGNYGSINGVSGSKFHSFLFGPELRFPAPVSPFVHALFGGAHLNTIAGSSKSFATAIGGGIDVHPAPIIGFRLIQVDYLYTHFNSTRQNNLRIGAGIELRF